jgi:hypothetical protein
MTAITIFMKFASVGPMNPDPSTALYKGHAKESAWRLARGHTEMLEIADNKASEGAALDGVGRMYLTPPA